MEVAVTGVQLGEDFGFGGNGLQDVSYRREWVYWAFDKFVYARDQSYPFPVWFWEEEGWVAPD